MGGGNHVPDGWLDCAPFGAPIHSTKIIPVKVPLKDAIMYKCPKGTIPWGPRELASGACIPKNAPKGSRVALVIDLTNTDRYYNPDELLSRGIEYAKLSVPGRENPPAGLIRQFIDTIIEFDRRSKPTDFVAVHCTHGHNRTGLMISKYILHRWQIAPEMNYPFIEPLDCLASFAKARAPGMYDEDFLTSIYDEFTVPQGSRTYPEQPPWKKDKKYLHRGHKAPAHSFGPGSSSSSSQHQERITQSQYHEFAYNYGTPAASSRSNRGDMWPAIE